MISQRVSVFRALLQLRAEGPLRVLCNGSTAFQTGAKPRTLGVPSVSSYNEVPLRLAGSPRAPDPLGSPSPGAVPHRGRPGAAARPHGRGGR